MATRALEVLRSTVLRGRHVIDVVTGKDHAKTVAALAADIDDHGAARRDGLRQRLAELARVLLDEADPLEAIAGRWKPTRPTSSTAHILERLVAAMSPIRPDVAWLMLATVEGALPTADRVRAAVRAAELDGPVGALRHAVWSGPLPRYFDAGPFYPVRIVTGKHLVDVHHTAQTDFATGIQRVTREATRRWMADHRPMLVGWRPDTRSIRALTPPEVHRACWGGPPVSVPTDDPIVVPWHCTYLLPELAAEVSRTAYLLALAQYSGTPLNLIGYDLVPVTTAETSHEGLIPGFASNLAAARHARNIVPISVASAGEYRGWRQMLAGTGLVGPVITPVVLPGQAPREDPKATVAARARLEVGGLPLVLVVGSHEPRKNHVAILHAAELLWRESERFCLAFIGGNAWNSEEFSATLAGLQGAGRPVESISAATDTLLFGGYRCARFTVFPSINEGFGLPVAESLACGTPAITSSYGSMAEIAAAGGGALLIDPRDDHAIADAMRSLLTDDELHARLVAEALARPVRTWDDYADEVWLALNAHTEG